ncbi:hypothetical protein [Nocardioides sp. AX2bis]|uniref:hypothetical protein n=1 Tax=Nocardioides sp. AX2bis TaxID=2653157 RepID=UPI0012F290FC|nr:hypothetical protein [Nocardioides sp. AX2bis]VXC53223.1 hypothetical protein NOCARDAX2BIS_80045 [Nocardioides sp. AX2bis]
MATSLGIFTAGVVLAHGLTGTLMTFALVATAVNNLLGRQVAGSTAAAALIRGLRAR